MQADTLPESTDSDSDTIACPWCGHEHGDLWEFFGRRDDAEVDCYECGKGFTLTRTVSVDYTATPIAPKEAPARG